MPSYVVAGASRGLGLEFVAQLASKPENVVFALARNPDTSKGLQALSSKSNVHPLKADITDPKSLQAAADAVAKVTGGSLDVLINNGAIQGDFFWNTIDEYTPEELVNDFRKVFDTNVLGTILPTNIFLPLLRKGQVKKVLSLSTGLADPASVLMVGNKYGAAYGITKVGVEMANIKYATKYKEEGFTFLTISPGIVKTDMGAPPEKPEHLARMMEAAGQFAKFAPPTFTGPIEASESISKMLSVLDSVTPEDSGKFLSHHGDRNWL